MAIGDAISGIFGGLFGDSGAPYDEAMKQYKKWTQIAQGYQNPFFNFGLRGMPGYEDWLGKMKDPSGFINNLMGQYQESPWAKYQQEQSVRAGQNAGSAGGLTGSTPLAQFMQQNARDISSQDMQNWLGNVLGINTQYGAGLGGQIGIGQNAANMLTNLFNQMGGRMGEAAYGRKAGEQFDRNNLWGGLFNLGGDLAGLFL